MLTERNTELILSCRTLSPRTKTRIQSRSRRSPTEKHYFSNLTLQNLIDKNPNSTYFEEDQIFTGIINGREETINLRRTYQKITYCTGPGKWFAFEYRDKYLEPTKKGGGQGTITLVKDIVNPNNYKVNEPINDWPLVEKTILATHSNTHAANPAEEVQCWQKRGYNTTFGPIRTTLPDGTEVDKIYIPFIPGYDLSELIYDKLSFEQCLEIAQHTINELAALNKLNIVHNDIKVANIRVILNEDKTVKSVVFIDYGSANQPFTMNSIYYQAPEVIINNSRSFNSDIFSTGVTLAVLFGINEQFNLRSQNLYLVSSSFNEQTALTTFKQLCPTIDNDLLAKLVNLIGNMTHPDPSKRYDINKLLTYWQNPSIYVIPTSLSSSPLPSLQAPQDHIASSSIQAQTPTQPFFFGNGSQGSMDFWGIPPLFDDLPRQNTNGDLSELICNLPPEFPQEHGQYNSFYFDEGFRGSSSNLHLFDPDVFHPPIPEFPQETENPIISSYDSKTPQGQKRERDESTPDKLTLSGAEQKRRRLIETKPDKSEIKSVQATETDIFLQNYHRAILETQNTTPLATSTLELPSLEQNAVKPTSNYPSWYSATNCFSE